MAFRFRLQALLDLRIRKRDAVRQDLADALASQRELDTRRNQMADDIHRHEQEVRQMGSGRIDINRLNRQRHYLAHLGQNLRQSEQEVTEAGKLVEQRQAELATAEQEVRLLEKLRDKQSEEYYFNQEKKAELQRDEAWLNTRPIEETS
ncbi:flagellar export protein FliJ [Thalassoroseus pseudoceratinae]|uniref:flagellar export protein FliJ n=1 Tax=Thalassoroseus pseudoceratinae TaxID=2713176 RepID=UPI0014205379|nr:flagellar export protein FliJ [Thalassoroseus pseudoceratinae]